MKRSRLELQSDSEDDEQYVLSDDEYEELKKDAEVFSGLRRNGGRSERLIQNNVPLLKAKDEELLLVDSEGKPLEWVETFVVDTEEPLKVPNLDDDLARETVIYNQTLANVHKAMALCAEFGVKHQRPDDYYAEMVKTDDHMLRLKDNLLAEQRRKEERNKQIKERQLKKYAKKVQVETKLKREKQKAEDLAVVKEWRKQHKRGNNATSGAVEEEFPEHLLDPKNPERKQLLNKSGPVKVQLPKSKKREAKDKKYGFGSKQKRFKRLNSANSSADVSTFNRKKNNAEPNGFKNRGRSFGPKPTSGPAPGFKRAPKNKGRR